MIYSGIVYDTLAKMGIKDNECLISREIRPLRNDSVIFSKVFTTTGQMYKPGSYSYEELDKIRLEIVNEINLGDIVLLQSNDTTDQIAHAGDITLQIYRKARASGFITDGGVRDSNLIINMKFPCFCKYVSPVDALNRWVLTSYGEQIELPADFPNQSLKINTGDYIFADNDGILLIKNEWAPDFFARIYDETRRENSIRKEINSGKNLDEIYRKYGRW